MKDRFALTTDSEQLVAVVIDLLNREVITVDRTVGQLRVACRNVVTDYEPTVDVCAYAMQLKSLSVKEMLGMRYVKFLKDTEWVQADVIGVRPAGQVQAVQGWRADSAYRESLRCSRYLRPDSRQGG